MGPMVDRRSGGSFAEVLQSDPEAWAIRIAARWRMGVESIIATGRLILEAKAALPHGQFGAMIREQLPFGERQAQMLMAIASHPRMSNPQYVSLLPPTLGTIYDATRLSDDEWEIGVESGIIRPDMERADIDQIRQRTQRFLAGPSSDGPTESRRGGDEPEERESTQRPHTETAAQVKNIGGDSDGVLGAGTSLRSSGSTVQEPSDDGELPEDANGQAITQAGVATGPSEATMPGGGLAIAHSRVEPLDSLDFFPTPPWATRALIEHVFDKLGRRGHCGWQVCWEPACGEGHMAEVLNEYFREVVASDIKDYGYGEHVVDFLTCEQLARKYDADWIITNPPFGENTDKFILKALSLAGTGVAMLVRLQCLETVGRYEQIFSKTPPTLISFFVERVPMHKGRWEPQGDTMTAYIWLTWIKGAEPQAPFWIPPGCKAALTKPDDAARFTQSPVQRRSSAPPAEAAE